MEGPFSALYFMLYMTTGSFTSSQIVKFPWLTPRYDYAFFLLKMSAIVSKNVCKHLLADILLPDISKIITSLTRGRPAQTQNKKKVP